MKSKDSKMQRAGFLISERKQEDRDKIDKYD